MVTIQSSLSMASLIRLPIIRSTLSIPKHIPLSKRPKEQTLSNTSTISNKNSTKTIQFPLLENITNINGGISTKTTVTQRGYHVDDSATLTFLKLNVILEAVLDRIEMHQNVGEQRDNWNTLLLNSLNMITLTAATMAGVSSMGGPTLSLKIASVLLFAAATGIVLIMNKIQPSQLVEEQRTAVRLFKQLRTKVQTKLELDTVTEKDVERAMESVLALDRAYPLPLLGTMIDKFPETFEPAVWWPNSSNSRNNFNSGIKLKYYGKKDGSNNGWSNELEEELRDIVGVIEKRDKKEYISLGNKALEFNKMLAKTSPTLMGVVALASAFSGHGGPWAGLVAAAAGSMASVVNSIQHGGQVGMIFEMYRNCGGFFSLLQESVDSTLEEDDLEKRENGELFEMKMGLKLGRSLSELKDFAQESSCSWLSENDGSPNKGEFASKLM